MACVCGPSLRADLFFIMHSILYPVGGPASANLVPCRLLTMSLNYSNTDSVMNDLILLAALMEGPQHGYALKKLAGFMADHGDMHNNLVYPLLRRFVENSWVTKRTTGGERGQKRDLYTLTSKGRLELLQRLSRFTEKEASSENEFRVRVGLFSMLERQARENILAE